MFTAPMITKALLTLLLAAFLQVSSPAYAYTVTCTNCSTELTAMLERITSLEQLKQLAQQVGEAIVQTEQQITMVAQNIERYENMIRNTLGLPQEIRQRLEGQYQRLADLYTRVKTYSNDLNCIRDAYRAVYPAFGGNLRELGQNFEVWSSKVDEANQALFELSEIQLGQLYDPGLSKEFDDQISDLLSTP